MISWIKFESEVKANAPIKNIFLPFDIVVFKTSTAATGYQLELNKSAAKINLNANDKWNISNIKLIFKF
jgi:hypothetical protein